jgi:hypothetical protein
MPQTLPPQIVRHKGDAHPIYATLTTRTRSGASKRPSSSSMKYSALACSTD